jgi:hypothetical protein
MYRGKVRESAQAAFDWGCNLLRRPEVVPVNFSEVPRAHQPEWSLLRQVGDEFPRANVDRAGFADHALA